MKNIFKLLVVVALIAFYSVGCKKNNPSVPKNGFSSVDSSQQVFTQNAMATQSYCSYNDTENYASPRMIYGSQGTVFSIPNFAFANSLGMSYPGPVCINFKEFYKTSDLILNNISTYRDLDTVNGHKQWIMKSEAIFYINVMAGGLPFNIVNPIGIEFPVNDTYNNEIYNANWDSLHFLGMTYPNTVWWVPNDVTTITQGYNQQNQFVDVIGCDSTGWINVADTNWWNGDQGGPTLTYTLFPPTSSSFSDVQIFLVLGKRIVAKAYPIYQGNTRYEIPNVPLHANGTLVAWCVSSGKQLLYQITPVTNLVNSNSTFTFSFTQTTSIDSLTTFIKALDAQY